MTAEENIKLLSKIIHAILKDELDKEMQESGYVVISSTDKRKEYQMK